MPPRKDVATGTWSALLHILFRMLWIMSFVAFIGASVQSTAAAWLSVELGGSALQVALVQGSMHFAMLIMALPAGMLADMFERRDVIISALVCMSVIAAVLGTLAITGHAGPIAVIALTFLFGLGATAITPALQATLPDLVPRSHLASAVTLNSIAVSSARAIGPAIAGVAISMVGSGLTLAVNAAAFAGIALLLLANRKISSRNPTPPERGAVWRGLADGLRYARHDRAFSRLLKRTVILAFCASPLLALVPLIVSEQLNADASALGLLLSAFGVGSLIGALSLSAWTSRFSRDQVILWASAIHGIALILVATIHFVPGIAAAMLIAGASWTALITSITVSAQLLVPADLRARGLSISLMSLMGSMALGGALWGQAAHLFGAQHAMVAGGCLALAISLILLLGSKADDPVSPAA
jgi:MFS family permease